MTRFRNDDRGVSELVGFLLVITMVVLVLAGVQAFGVPNWNQGVEQAHVDTTQGDLIDLRGAIVDTAGVGNERTTRVTLGTRYPERIAFLNPPPPEGRLETTQPESVRIDNVDAAGNAGEFWAQSPDDRPIETQTIQYAPRYNELSNPPRPVIEHGFLFNRFDDDVELERAHRNLIDGNRISLLTVAGDLNRVGIEPTAVETTPASAPTQRVAIGADDESEPIELDLPTTLGEDAWQEALDDKYDPDGSSSLVAPPTVDAGVLELRLDPGRQYQLRLARVGLGDNVDSEEAAYIAVDGREQVPVGSDLAVQVRDRYNNPVANEPVEIESVDGECRTDLPSTKRTDANGNVFVACTGPATLSFSIGSESYESVTARAGGGGTTPPSVDSVTVDAETDEFARLEGASAQTLSQVTVNYEASDDDRIGAVAIDLLDGSADLVTATTHTVDEGDTVEGQWVTPWLAVTAAAVDDYEVRVRAIDGSGTASDPCTVTVADGGGVCP